MDEQEREEFIRKIGISVDSSDDTDEEDEDYGQETHKYSCKKCQVSHTHTDIYSISLADVSKTFMDILNHSLSQSIISTCFKVSTTVPVPKQAKVT